MWKYIEDNQIELLFPIIRLQQTETKIITIKINFANFKL